MSKKYFFKRASKQNFEKEGIFYLGSKFIVDKDIFELYKNRCWSDNGNGYARCVDGYLHKLVCPNFKIVDHINRNKSDNRRINLRSSTSSLNAFNSTRKVGSTGFRGVYKKVGRKNWFAQVRLEGKNLYLGTFSDISDAVSKVELFYKNNLNFNVV